MDQTPLVVRTSHSHDVQRKHLLVKGWYDPIVILIEEEAQFQHYHHLSCLVVQIKGWVYPGEADGHMKYPAVMLHPNLLLC